MVTIQKPGNNGAPNAASKTRGRDGNIGCASGAEDSGNGVSVGSLGSNPNRVGLFLSLVDYLTKTHIAKCVIPVEAVLPGEQYNFAIVLNHDGACMYVSLSLEPSLSFQTNLFTRHPDLCSLEVLIHGVVRIQPPSAELPDPFPSTSYLAVLHFESDLRKYIKSISTESPKLPCQQIRLDNPSAFENLIPSAYRISPPSAPSLYPQWNCLFELTQSIADVFAPNAVLIVEVFEINVPSDSHGSIDFIAWTSIPLTELAQPSIRDGTVARHTSILHMNAPYMGVAEEACEMHSECAPHEFSLLIEMRRWSSRYFLRQKQKVTGNASFATNSGAGNAANSGAGSTSSANQNGHLASPNTNATAYPDSIHTTHTNFLNASTQSLSSSSMSIGAPGPGNSPQTMISQNSLSVTASKVDSQQTMDPLYTTPRSSFMAYPMLLHNPPPIPPPRIFIDPSGATSTSSLGNLSGRISTHSASTQHSSANGGIIDPMSQAIRSPLDYSNPSSGNSTSPTATTTTNYTGESDAVSRSSSSAGMVEIDDDELLSLDSDSDDDEETVGHPIGRRARSHHLDDLSGEYKRSPHTLPRTGSTPKPLMAIPTSNLSHEIIPPQQQNISDGEFSGTEDDPHYHKHGLHHHQQNQFRLHPYQMHQYRRNYASYHHHQAYNHQYQPHQHIHEDEESEYRESLPYVDEQDYESYNSVNGSVNQNYFLDTISEATEPGLEDAGSLSARPSRTIGSANSANGSRRNSSDLTKLDNSDHASVVSGGGASTGSENFSHSSAGRGGTAGAGGTGTNSNNVTHTSSLTIGGGTGSGGSPSGKRSSSQRSSLPSAVSSPSTPSLSSSLQETHSSLMQPPLSPSSLGSTHSPLRVSIPTFGALAEMGPFSAGAVPMPAPGMSYFQIPNNSKSSNSSVPNSHPFLAASVPEFGSASHTNEIEHSSSIATMQHQSSSSAPAMTIMKPSIPSTPTSPPVLPPGVAFSNSIANSSGPTITSSQNSLAQPNAAQAGNPQNTENHLSTRPRRTSTTARPISSVHSSSSGHSSSNIGGSSGPSTPTFNIGGRFNGSNSNTPSSHNHPLHLPEVDSPEAERNRRLLELRIAELDLDTAPESPEKRVLTSVLPQVRHMVMRSATTIAKATLAEQKINSLQTENLALKRQVQRLLSMRSAEVSVPSSDTPSSSAVNAQNSSSPTSSHGLRVTGTLSKPSRPRNSSIKSHTSNSSSPSTPGFQLHATSNSTASVNTNTSTSSTTTAATTTVSASQISPSNIPAPASASPQNSSSHGSISDIVSNNAGANAATSATTAPLASTSPAEISNSIISSSAPSSTFNTTDTIPPPSITSQTSSDSDLSVGSSTISAKEVVPEIDSLKQEVSGSSETQKDSHTNETSNDASAEPNAVEGTTKSTNEIGNPENSTESARLANIGVLSDTIASKSDLTTILEDPTSEEFSNNVAIETNNSVSNPASTAQPSNEMTTHSDAMVSRMSSSRPITVHSDTSSNVAGETNSQAANSASGSSSSSFQGPNPSPTTLTKDKVSNDSPSSNPTPSSNAGNSNSSNSADHISAMSVLKKSSDATLSPYANASSPQLTIRRIGPEGALALGKGSQSPQISPSASGASLDSRGAPKQFSHAVVTGTHFGGGGMSSPVGVPAGSILPRSSSSPNALRLSPSTSNSGLSIGITSPSSSNANINTSASVSSPKTEYSQLMEEISSWIDFSERAAKDQTRVAEQIANKVADDFVTHFASGIERLKSESMALKYSFTSMSSPSTPSHLHSSNPSSPYAQHAFGPNHAIEANSANNAAAAGAIISELKGELEKLKSELEQYQRKYLLTSAAFGEEVLLLRAKLKERKQQLQEVKKYAASISTQTSNVASPSTPSASQQSNAHLHSNTLTPIYPAHHSLHHSNHGHARPKHYIALSPITVPSAPSWITSMNTTSSSHPSMAATNGQTNLSSPSAGVGSPLNMNPSSSNVSLSSSNSHPIVASQLSAGSIQANGNISSPMQTPAPFGMPSNNEEHQYDHQENDNQHELDSPQLSRQRRGSNAAAARHGSLSLYLDESSVGDSTSRSAPQLSASGHNPTRDVPIKSPRNPPSSSDHAPFGAFSSPLPSPQLAHVPPPFEAQTSSTSSGKIPRG